MLESLTHTESVLFAGSLLLLLSVVASKAMGRLGVPALLVFLGLGMLAGSEGIGGIYFDDASLAQTLGVIALVYILFSGGLDTHQDSIRKVLRPGILLSTLGVVLTCAMVALFAKGLLDLSWKEGLLVGAIVSSTDAAAVFSVLRSRGIHLRGNLKPLLELESGSNDPMAVFLTTAFLGLLMKESDAYGSLFIGFLLQMSLGLLCGFVFGRFTSFVVNRVRLEFEGLYPVLSLSLVVLAYSITQWMGGNGFLAVYIAGIILGRQNFLHKKSLLLFHDGLAWLMQIAMFLALGLLVFPSQLAVIMVPAILLSLFLIFVARPLAVFGSLSFEKLTFREKALISWVGLRGAVPIVFATFPLLAGAEKSEMIFNLVFFVVLTSVLVQAPAIPWVARLLKVDAPAQTQFRYPIEYVPTENMKSEMLELEVQPGSHAAGKAIIDLHLPEDILILLIHRENRILIPRGSTRLESGDRMLTFAKGPSLELLHGILRALKTF